MEILIPSATELHGKGYSTDTIHARYQQEHSRCIPTSTGKVPTSVDQFGPHTSRHIPQECTQQPQRLPSQKPPGSSHLRPRSVRTFPDAGIGTAPDRS